MATVYNPVMPRRYNPNPRGSATTQVTMPGHNPFEQKTRLVNRSGTIAQLAGLRGFGPSGALPGMGFMGGGHLGDDTTDDGSGTSSDAAAAAAYAAAANAAGEATASDPGAATAFDVDAAADQAQSNVAAAGGSQAQQTAAYYSALTSSAATSDAAVAQGVAAANNPQMVAAAAATLPAGSTAKPAAATGINWNSIFSTAVTGAGTTGAALISAKYGKKPAAASTPLAQIAASSMTPWVIGGVCVLGLVLVLTMHKPK